MTNQLILSTIPQLETENYLLRGIMLQDTNDLFTFMQDKETMKFITAYPVQSEQEMEEAISRQLDNFLAHKEIPWVIIHKESGQLVGQFRLHKLHVFHQKAEMGAVIRKEYQKKGVMTEVLGVILPFFFETLKLNRLVGDIFAGNVGSRKLLEKFGFHKDGVLRQTDYDGVRFHDTVVYSLLKEEYEYQMISPLVRSDCVD